MAELTWSRCAFFGPCIVVPPGPALALTFNPMKWCSVFFPGCTCIGVLLFFHFNFFFVHRLVVLLRCCGEACAC